MYESKPVTLAFGDGIGPQIMEATLEILREVKAKFSVDTIEIGQAQYKFGNKSGISSSAWESLRRSKVLLKGPVTVEEGCKNPTVAIGETFRFFAHLHPFVSYPHPRSDFVIVSGDADNPDDERLMHCAFDYAAKHGRRKVTCAAVGNEAFAELFDRIGAQHADIEKEHRSPDSIVLEGADVIVALHAPGDILLQKAAQISAPASLRCRASLAENFVLFETAHGSAPDIAGEDIANPSGLLNAAIMMLEHIGQPETADLIRNAWAATLASGIHTADIYTESSQVKVSTMEFAEAVINHLGEMPLRANS